MKLEKVSKDVSMRQAIVAVAGPYEGNRKGLWALAARHAGVSYRAAKSLWYGEISDPEHKAARRMTDAARRHGAIEAQELAGRYEKIASAMRITDADFHSADIAALVHAARLLRGQDRAGNDRDRALSVRDEP